MLNFFKIKKAYSTTLWEPQQPQTVPVPSTTIILLCDYYVVHLHFSCNPISLNDYNAIWTLFIIQLQHIFLSLSFTQTVLAFNAHFSGLDVSMFWEDHPDQNLN